MARKKVVVITGASAGVGRATVRQFARRGTRIGLVARGHDGLEGARREVEGLGGEALAIPADVADAEQVEASIDRAEAELGPIDILINNAMASVFSPIKEMTAAEFKRVTEVTYLGYVYTTLSVLKRMLPRDRGVIVNVGSALAYRRIPLQAAYCAAMKCPKRCVSRWGTRLWTAVCIIARRCDLTQARQQFRHPSEQIRFVRCYFERHLSPSRL